MSGLLLVLAMNVAIPHDFTARAYQEPLMRYLDNGGKRAFVVWPRRHGKDLVMAHQTCKAAHIRTGVYWHFFPTLEHGRRSLWEAFTADGKRTLECVFPGFSDPRMPGSVVRRKNEQQMFLELKCGSLWRVMGTDKISSVGAGPVGVVWSEYALGKPNAWNLVRPMLRENGGWSVFITTPRGKNHAFRLYESARKLPGWFHDKKTVYETGLTFASEAHPDRRLSPDEMMAEELASGMPSALVDQEYKTDFNAANVGAVFGDMVSDAVEFEHPFDGIYTSWDLGISDATAIWFWRLGPTGVDFIDHLEANGKPFSYFADALAAKPYEYVRHYLPHDARARTLVTGTSVQDAAMDLWPGKAAIAPGLGLADGIQAGRWLLGQRPRFHERCAAGVEALRSYHYEWDADRKTLARLPLHDWSSHTADAFRYAATVVKVTRLVDEKAPAPKPRPVRSGAFGPTAVQSVCVHEWAEDGCRNCGARQTFSLDELWEDA